MRYLEAIFRLATCTLLESKVVCYCASSAPDFKQHFEKTSLTFA